MRVHSPGLPLPRLSLLPLPLPVGRGHTLRRSDYALCDAALSTSARVRRASRRWCTSSYRVCFVFVVFLCASLDFAEQHGRALGRPPPMFSFPCCTPPPPPTPSLHRPTPRLPHTRTSSCSPPPSLRLRPFEVTRLPRRHADALLSPSPFLQRSGYRCASPPPLPSLSPFGPSLLRLGARVCVRAPCQRLLRIVLLAHWHGCTHTCVCVCCPASSPRDPTTVAPVVCTLSARRVSFGQYASLLCFVCAVPRLLHACLVGRRA